MSIIREIRDFCRLLWGKGKRELVFYAEHEGYYAYYEGLIDCLTNVMEKQLSYITSDSRDPLLDNPPSGVLPFYLDKLLPAYMVATDCSVMVMTLTDLDQLYIKRSKFPVHYVYVFHSLVSTHMMYRVGAFDNYDSILCPGPSHVEEIRSRETAMQLPHKKLVEAGYYRLERIHKKHEELLSKKKDNVNSPDTILIAPSWGEENLIVSCGERLTEILLNEGYNVIIRPHPEIVRRTPEVLDHLDKKYAQEDRFIIERSVSTDNSLHKADLLICDCSGIAIEYALGTERPVLFIDVPIKVKNSEYKNLGLEPIELRLREKIGVIVSPLELETVAGTVKELIAHAPDYVPVLRKVREEMVFEFGASSAVGAEYIKGLLKTDV